MTTTIKIEICDDEVESEAYVITTDATFVLPSFLKLVSAVIAAHKSEWNFHIDTLRTVAPLLNELFGRFGRNVETTPDTNPLGIPRKNP